MKNPTMVKTGRYWSVSHLVTDRRNLCESGDCELLVTGYGWCRYSNKLSSVLINGQWWSY